MKITASHLIEVDIDPSEVRNISLKFLEEIFNWRRSYELETEADGSVWVCNCKVGHSSHVFKYKEKIRVATEDDILACKVIQKILSSRNGTSS
jgi:hypothetical protein